MKKLDIIYNPTQNLIDDQLMEIIRISDKSKEVYKYHKEKELETLELVDRKSEETDDNGKKVYRYKTDAEKAVRLQNEGLIHDCENLKIEKKHLESDLSISKMLYYHAVKKLTENKQIDVEASIRGGVEDDKSNDEAPF